MSFLEKWLEAVDKKNSVICAGLDPAVFEMGRKDEGLPRDAYKLVWSLNYLEAVAPIAAATKPNFHYWKSESDIANLDKIFKQATQLSMVDIEDSKLADIGSTNDAGFFYAAKRADAVTLAPYAGNMGEAAKQAKARHLGLITMCLMTNPEYAIEKNMLVPVSDPDTYDKQDLQQIGDQLYVKRFIQLAHDANKFGLDGIVVGAPSADNHIKEEEIAKVRVYAGDKMLVLMPGIGKQKGFAQIHFKYFHKDMVIANIARQLMFPNGMNSTPEDQLAAAKKYQQDFNELRA
jgi:orotidine-5'-phosphate decarboxylase